MITGFPKRPSPKIFYFKARNFPMPSVAGSGAVLAAVLIVGQIGWSHQRDLQQSAGTAACTAGMQPNTIMEVQGSGASSPLVGTTVTVRGTVTADFQGPDQAGGYFIQDVVGDGNPATSDGIYILSRAPGVSSGDSVVVTGLVSEFNGLTEITPTSVIACSSGNPLPNAVVIPSLPSQANQALLEQFEGMLVTLAAETTIQDTFVLGRYGKMIIGEGGRQFVGTQIAEPGPDALAAESSQQRIVIGDALTRQNPVPAPFGLSPQNPIRAGDTFAPGSVSGVLTYETYTTSPAYTILPISALPTPMMSNPRPANPPAVGGTLQVVSANVLNYFKGPPFPTARGASNQVELERQRVKVVAALSALNADVYGLSEVANDGYGPNSSITDLLAALNAAVPGADFRAFYPGKDVVGTDQISVKLVYKASTVKPLGIKIMDSTVDPDFIDTLNRPSLIGTFVELATGGKFTVVVNHLKSKGSDCNAVGDTDKGDGQGNCNLVRTKAAMALMKYLATDPTGSHDPNFIVLGDLNAYLMEDPVEAIKIGIPGTPVADLMDVNDASSWSYVFDGRSGTLDHILYTSSLAAQRSNAGTPGEWHINGDEPIAADYNTEFNQPGLYTAGPFRASDHDPLAIGLAQPVSYVNLVRDVLISDVLSLELAADSTTALLKILNKALAAAQQLDSSERSAATLDAGDSLFIEIGDFLDAVDKLEADSVLTTAQANLLTARANIILNLLTTTSPAPASAPAPDKAPSAAPASAPSSGPAPSAGPTSVPSGSPAATPEGGPAPAAAPALVATPMPTLTPAILTEYGQCGGLSNCPASLLESSCQDNTYPDTRCPTGFYCRRFNEYYWQCIPGSQPDDLPPPLVQPPPGVSVLTRYAQCGGQTGDCATYGPAFCADSAYPGYACSAGFGCERQNQYYWQCIRVTLTVPVDGGKPCAQTRT
ncbi:hypothetical protein WJX72_005064 [[Myrmecia] bisecta]|uniref:CBM1 domain-containing protein n=1 Tax=[Myrmecia] bisecta TaxID=41462 RepID=A0AAW1PHG7_9CHLO